MYMSENNMLVQDALTRIDSVLNSPSLSQSDKPRHPQGQRGGAEERDFQLRRQEERAGKRVPLRIGEGQTVAFVGPVRQRQVHAGEPARPIL